jgi:hypothetical protein
VVVHLLRTLEYMSVSLRWSRRVFVLVRLPVVRGWMGGCAKDDRMMWKEERKRERSHGRIHNAGWTP